jgi:hypothetical protein|tara:strand:+ start:96 stop:332 length:237 start_codon:yes stop_codon:yes gene_type:complete
MIKQTITGTITNIKRMNNSIMGNPNFKLLLEIATGVEIPVSTLNDSSVNYKIHGGMEGKKVTLQVKVNKYSNKLLEVV